MFGVQKVYHVKYTMLYVVLLPVIKNKSRRINDSDNYRPIALANIVSQVVENVFLNRLSVSLLTTCNQLVLKTSLVLICVYMPSKRY